MIQPHELLIYFVATSTDTILRKIPDAIASLDAGGFTVFMRDGQHASEVYADIGSSDFVARP